MLRNYSLHLSLRKNSSFSRDCPFCKLSRECITLNLERNTAFFHQIFSLACDWSEHATWLNICQLNWEISQWFSKNTPKSTRIFVLGHYLYTDQHRFPRAILSEDRSRNIRAYFRANEAIFFYITETIEFCKFSSFANVRRSCLKEHCHRDFTCLVQFCQNYCLFRVIVQKNAPTESARWIPMKF